MPKQPIDYSKTIIYRIVCKNPEIKDCYIGSTTDFKSRKQKHKSNCNRETSKEFNLKVYKNISIQQNESAADIQYMRTSALSFKIICIISKVW